MDIKLFYGSKEQDPCVRQIPSDSEDSEIDGSDNEEEWNGEKGLSRSEKISSDSSSGNHSNDRFIQQTTYKIGIKYQAVFILVVFLLSLEFIYFIYIYFRHPRYQ